jgi:two-component system, OmpR family, sensor histidine kinase KdpD
MQRVDIHGFWRSGVRAIPGTLLVGLVTFISYGLGLNFTVTGFLYLIIVVLQSLFGDFVSSAVVSIIADLCLNFFFIPPIFSFRVSDSSDIWALIAFLITGLVVTRLTTQVRREAEISELQRRDMKRLYELAQRLLALDPDDAAMTKAVELFREVFGVQAVCLYDGASAELHSGGESRHGLAERTRAAYISRQDGDDDVSGVFIRCLRAAGKTIGAVGFDGLRDAELTAGPLTALAAALLERARVFRDASHAAATAQAEVFRGAILDALAHEFKTPLATIVTAAGGLRETGGLRAEQLELAEVAETEASQLGLLTSRLLRIARLDKEEVRPQLELTNVADLVAQLADQYSRRTDRKVSLVKDVASAEVLADAELLQLALRQLLDNACKYSPAGSAIKIAIEIQHEAVAVRVWNSGSLVPVSDRARIFERFYRGSEARHLAPGSGLGLYVARKIAQAHGGGLDLEPDAAEGTSFRLTLPLAPGDLADGGKRS